jgi:hypothetical protein
MSSGEIFRISGGGQPNDLLSVSLTYDYQDFSDEPVIFQFKISGTTGQGTEFDFETIAEADTVRDQLTMRFNGLTPLASCLLGCAGSALIKPLLTCMTTDRDEFIKCLKSHGIEVTTELFACCIACLHT